MESMQTYLPLIKAMLSEWYIFTLNNALYAAVLAITVWLLTAIFYSIRIAAIKRSKVVNERAAAKNFDAMQQQLQLSQEELASTAEQMEKAQSIAEDESQRTQELEQLIYQRNQHIAGTIQTLATSFDLGERPQLASEDVKSDSLWQQHDKVIMQLIERLRTEQQAKNELQQTCQAATEKLAEKEALLNALQSTLDNHTNQLSKLEQALEEQKSILQQQNNSQQVLSDTLKNFQPTVTQPIEPKIEPKPEIFRAASNWQQPIQIVESPSFEDTVIVQPAPDKQVEQIIEEPQAAPTWQVEQTPAESVRVIEEEESSDLVLDEDMQPVIRKTPSVSSGIEQQAAAPAKGSLGKIKNLFGKKQPPVKTEPQWADTTSDEISPQSTDQSSADQQPNEKAPGKLKGFYGKFRSKDK
ncbi:MAG: hypothetical protein ACXWE4_02045 [Methylobacter sp.]